MYKHNIKILGVNTYLHHATFDRVTRSGYKDNFVYCICSNEDKAALRRELKYTDFIGNDGQYLSYLLH